MQPTAEGERPEMRAAELWQVLWIYFSFGARLGRLLYGKYNTTLCGIQKVQSLQESSMFFSRMFVAFLLLTAPASRKANPACITEINEIQNILAQVQLAVHQRAPEIHVG